MIHLLMAMLVLACLPLEVAAQDTGQQAEERRSLPEEVVIVGERRLRQLRTELMEAEREAYETFNRFNDEKRFEITCASYEPIGTHLETRLCKPHFEREAARAHAQDYFESLRDAIGFGGVPNSSPRRYPPMEAMIASQRQAYQRKMRQVAEEHPEFLEALIRYTEKRE